MARGLMGVAAVFTSAIIFTYTGETATIMDQDRQKLGKKSIKNMFYLAVTFTTHGYHVLLLGNLYSNEAISM